MGMNYNSPRWKSFRRIVPYKIRLVFGFIIWAIVVAPVYIAVEAIRGAKLGWQDAKELWKEAVK